MRFLLAAGLLFAVAAAVTATEPSGTVPFGGRLLTCIAVSPDGATIAMGGDESKGKALVILWNLKAGKERVRLRPDATSLQGLVFSTDGKRLLVVPGNTRFVSVYGTETGRVDCTLTGADGETILDAAFSNDGALVAALCKDKKVLVFDVPGGKLARSITMPHSAMTLVASPVEAVFATIGEDAKISFRDFRTGSLQRQISLPDAGTFSAAWSPDGKSLAAGGLDGKVRVWDAAGGKLQHELPHQNGYAIGCVRFSPDGSLVAARTGKLPKGVFDALGALAAGGPIRLWDARSGKVLGDQPDAFYPPVPNSSTVAFTPDGNTLVTVGSEGFSLWDVRKLLAEATRERR
jgi:WD40 repeat protein